MTNRLTRIHGWGTKLNLGSEVSGGHRTFADAMNLNGLIPTVS